MATVKVTALAETTSPQAADVLLISQSGVSKKVQITNLPAGTPGTGSISTTMLADDAVTTDKLANAINSAITANTAKTSNATHSGDVTGATALTIAADAVTYAKMQNVSADERILGRVSGANGVIEELTKAQMLTMLNVEDGSTADQTAAQIKTALENGIDSVHYVDGSIDTAHIGNDQVTADKLANSINTDIATGVTANTTANAALAKAGGSMTGDIGMGANDISLNDNGKLKVGSHNDLNIYHDGSNSYIEENTGTGSLILSTNGTGVDVKSNGGENIAKFIKDGAVELYHNNVKKIETTANGVTVTGGAVGTMTTDNDGSFAMSASNNFKCTPAGNFALTFTAIVAQSGNILFINSGGHTISAHANTKVDATLLATISTAGTYLLSYFSDGTNVYMTNSAAYA